MSGEDGKIAVRGSGQAGALLSLHNPASPAERPGYRRSWRSGARVVIDAATSSGTGVLCGWETAGGTRRASRVPVSDCKARYPLLSLSSLLSRKSSRGTEMNKRLALQGRDGTEGKGDLLNLLYVLQRHKSGGDKRYLGIPNPF